MQVYKKDSIHCAFTDLIKHKDYWYLCFREGEEHSFCKSKIVILRSKNGKDWDYYSETQEFDDVRDPRFILLGSLYLIVNLQSFTRSEVTGHNIGIGKVCEYYTKVSKEYSDIFLTQIEDDSIVGYDCVNGGKIYKGWALRDGGRISFCSSSLPAFSDSTEVAIRDRDYFVRRDSGKNYWIKETETGYEIVNTSYKIHCPYIFKHNNKYYLLGRETESDIGRYSWDEFCDRMAKLKLWLICDYELLELYEFKGMGDCGYFGYADGLVSYYSMIDKSNRKETAIYIKDIKDILCNAQKAVKTAQDPIK